jgi:murein DD-endopeptidase MepM/ murein hydrolase activator NlpD
LVVALVGLGYFVVPRFEWHAPSVTLKPDTDAIGLSPIEITVSDSGTGLQSVGVTLISGSVEHSLATEIFDRPLAEKRLTVALSSKVTGLKEGPALFRVRARDRSWWGFFRGNEKVIEKNVNIDITPPKVEIIADDPYINFGGSGLLAFKTSEDTVRSGVKIGKYFFPGYKGQLKDPNVTLAFFAHPYDVPEDEKAFLVATDKAGNSRQLPLSYSLKNVAYKKSKISVSDEFIQNKVAPLLNDVAARQGSPKEIFIAVNRGLRKENEDKITKLGEKTANKILWSGAFSQLSNSKVEANFADARTYFYQEESIDSAYHLGFDLSVTKRYPAEAANSGVVVFVGDLGIYGNAIILDHGLGLATLYAHLSSIDVKEGESVKQRQIIGRTGETGLAVGDHLHFATLLHGVPVLPKEWWDPKWIRDNIEPKLDPSIETATEPARAAQKTTRTKRR